MSNELIKRSEFMNDEMENQVAEICKADPKKYLRSIDLWFRRNDALFECSKSSVYSAIMGIASLGLDPTPDLHQVALIPRKGVCEVEIMAQGFTQLIYRELGIIIRSDVIYDEDNFEFYTGTEEKLVHKPHIGKSRGDKISAYAVAIFPETRLTITEIMSEEEIMACKAASSSSHSDFSAWNGPFEGEMWKKSAIKRLSKRLPKSDKINELELMDNDNYDFKLMHARMKDSDVIDIETNDDNETNEPEEDEQVTEAPQSFKDSMNYIANNGAVEDNMIKVRDKYYTSDGHFPAQDKDKQLQLFKEIALTSPEISNIVENKKRQFDVMCKQAVNSGDFNISGICEKLKGDE